VASLSTQRDVPDGVGATLAVLSGAAAAIHFAVIGEHFEEYWAFGTFFLVLAWSRLSARRQRLLNRLRSRSKDDHRQQP